MSQWPFQCQLRAATRAVTLHLLNRRWNEGQTRRRCRQRRRVWRCRRRGDCGAQDETIVVGHWHRPRRRLLAGRIEWCECATPCKTAWWLADRKTKLANLLEAGLSLRRNEFVETTAFELAGPLSVAVLEAVMTSLGVELPPLVVQSHRLRAALRLADTTPGTLVELVLTQAFPRAKEDRPKPSVAEWVERACGQQLSPAVRSKLDKAMELVDHRLRTPSGDRGPLGSVLVPCALSGPEAQFRLAAGVLASVRCKLPNVGMYVQRHVEEQFATTRNTSFPSKRMLV